MRQPRGLRVNRDGTDVCQCDLAWIAGLAENLVGHHLKILREAGLAGSRRDGKIVFYALTPTGRQLLDATVASGERV